MDDVQMGAAVEGLAATTAYLFGRKTFEKMAAYWPYQPDDDPIAANLNATPKYVATHTLREPVWNNSHVLRGELKEDVANLKGTATVTSSFSEAASSSSSSSSRTSSTSTGCSCTPSCSGPGSGRFEIRVN